MKAKFARRSSAASATKSASLVRRSYATIEPASWGDRKSSSSSPLMFHTSTHSADASSQTHCPGESVQSEQIAATSIRSIPRIAESRVRLDDVPARCWRTNVRHRHRQAIEPSALRYVRVLTILSLMRSRYASSWRTLKVVCNAAKIRAFGIELRETRPCFIPLAACLITS